MTNKLKYVLQSYRAIFSCLTIITYVWSCCYKNIFVINTVSCLNFKHFNLLCFSALLEIYYSMHSPNEKLIILSYTISCLYCLAQNDQSKFHYQTKLSLKYVLTHLTRLVVTSDPRLNQWLFFYRTSRQHRDFDLEKWVIKNAERFYSKSLDNGNCLGHTFLHDYKYLAFVSQIFRLYTPYKNK